MKQLQEHVETLYYMTVSARIFLSHDERCQQEMSLQH